MQIVGRQKKNTKNNNETEKMAADGEMPKNSKKKNSFFPLEFFDLRRTDDFLFLWRIFEFRLFFKKCDICFVQKHIYKKAYEGHHLLQIKGLEWLNFLNNEPIIFEAVFALAPCQSVMPEKVASSGLVV